MTIVKGIRKPLSELVGTRLERRYRRAVASGHLWSVPFAAWWRVPLKVRQWMKRRVIKPGEDDARILISQDSLLSDLLSCWNGWSLSPATMVFLSHLLESQRPRMIVEFGSGLSTLLFASYAARNGNHGLETPTVYSFEHDPDWLEAIRNRLVSLDLHDYVNLVHSEISCRELFGVWRSGYNPSEGMFDALVDGRGFDLCLVDGPPGTIGRFGCLPLVEAWLAPGATVLLDDANRDGEQADWEEWLRHFPSSLRDSRMVLTSRGLAVGRWWPRPGRGDSTQVRSIASMS